MLMVPALNDSQIETIDYQAAETAIDRPAAEWVKVACTYAIPPDTISGTDMLLLDYADQRLNRQPQLHAKFLDRAYSELVDAVNSAFECVGDPCTLSQALRSKSNGIKFAAFYESDHIEKPIWRRLVEFLSTMAQTLEQENPPMKMENAVLASVSKIDHATVANDTRQAA